MATNPYFQHTKEKVDQELIENLIIECIQFNGFDIHYIIRDQVDTNHIFGEDAISKFKDAYVIEGYLENFTGSEGEGHILSKFGIENREYITISMAKKRFTELVTSHHSDITRPREGDLMYIPFMAKGIYEIKYVEHKEPYYQLGKRYVYKLKAEIFRYSSEDVETGVQDIDNLSKTKKNVNSTAKEPFADNDAFEQAADGPKSTDLFTDTGTDDRGTGDVNFDEESPFTKF